MKKLSLLTLSSILCASVAFFSLPTMSIAAPAKKTMAAKKVKKENKAESEEEVQKKFEKFAVEKLESFNRTTLNSIKRKKVVKNPNGTYTASYSHFNKDSIRCSFKDATNTTSGVKYIGNFSYIQEEFISTATTEKEALAGPFVKNMQTPVSELVKYKNGKWSY